MTVEQQQIFVKYVVLFDSWTKEIPLTFLLGFYVAMIIRRCALMLLAIYLSICLQFLRISRYLFTNTSLQMVGLLPTHQLA